MADIEPIGWPCHYFAFHRQYRTSAAIESHRFNAAFLHHSVGDIN
jgi:hypothetical protein